jgi:D-alanyl-D-alanine carboxypeptidase
MGTRVGTAIRLVAATGALVLLAGVTAPLGAANNPTTPAELQRAVDALVAQVDGPPGAIVVVHRGGERRIFRAGVTDLRTREPIELDDHMRVASVAKAFSSATALSLVAKGTLSLDDTVGKWRPDLAPEWSEITLRQLLNHTSGIRDFSKEDGFLPALVDSLTHAPPPAELLDFIRDKRPAFTPGTRYQYSNSDNIIVALIVEAATGLPYATVMARELNRPLGLTDTSLPFGATMPKPFVRGYDVDGVHPPEDVSQLFAAGWTFASGGVVSTPADVNRFVRRYVSGRETNAATRAQQFTFITGGSSEPPGPGANSAGLGVFRYETRCGTVYGHTGNTSGYTQFISATADGTRSATVSINAQITPDANAVRFAQLRNLYETAVCAALR